MVRAKVTPSGLDGRSQAWAAPNGDPGVAGNDASPESGCLPFTNCCVIVPQDKWFSVERFGKNRGILSPGLTFAGFDCFGLCLGFRSVSSRIAQSLSTVTTKTRDNVFVTLTVAAQVSVGMEGAAAAMYKLSNRDMQIDSYVSDVVRGEVPALFLDEAFEKRDAIASEIEKRLQKEMLFYGIIVHKVLITDIEPDSEVIQSMNEINKQKRLRDAVEMSAEADKIRRVKAAEASAEATHLKGVGVARQRRAIIEGLDDGICQAGEDALPLGQIRELLVMSQYHETLRHIANECQEQSLFLSHEVGALFDASEQVKKGLQVASAAPGQVRM
mmetsp:Transcript_25407/g.69356  ORF Transcript_25407/g.69356 Transcript_25407/m.69356 type:complete len:329 (-) Transcript_25407:85-1071(-)